jgi:hypothetical protein
MNFGGLEGCSRTPRLRAAFAYGAHTAAVVQLGYPAGKILPLPDQLPLILMGGTQDGVIANSSDSGTDRSADREALFQRLATPQPLIVHFERK